jgi:L-ornithine N5-oxygenase
MKSVDVLMVGTGPSNIALAIGMEERADLSQLGTVVMLERDASTNWHKNMLFPESQSQVSFLKDMVTMRDPTSKFSFLNFLHKTGKLEEFVNLQSFFPYRREISSYLQWAVNTLSKVEVKYSSEVIGIQPVLDMNNLIEGWIVSTRKGDVYRAKRLVFGTGREANIPANFKRLDQDRVFHSSMFLSRVKPYLTTPVANIAVIGGAQSSAEVYQACIEMFPEARVRMLMRSIGLTNYGGSKFINAIYQNDYIDVFYNTNASAKKEILASMHTTNYAGVAPATMESLHRFHYLQNLSGKTRAQMSTQCEVIDTENVEGGVKLCWKNNLDGSVETDVFDFVALGTGYLNAVPALLKPTLELLRQNDFNVTRFYRATLPCAPGVSLHLQGINESTHGIADTLLSVIASRSIEILDDLLSVSAPAPRTGAPANGTRRSELAGAEMLMS